MKVYKGFENIKTRFTPHHKFLFAAILVLGLVFGKPHTAFADLVLLDPTFGVGGIVTTDTGDDSETAYTVALQSDGKIVVGGNSRIVRYNDDGSLDSAFGTNGVVTIEINEYDVNINAITIQDDEKIITAGTGYNGSNYGFAVVQFNSNGTVDTGFGDSGLAFFSFGSGNHNARAVALQSDGKIIVAGSFYSGNINLENVAIAQFESDGTLNSTWTTDFEHRSERAYAVVIQSDDKIVVAGDHHNGFTYDFLVIRYNSNGSLDSTFGTNGIMTTAIDTGIDIGRAVALQNDGKIVVAGWCETGPYSVVRKRDFAVVRYNSDGSLDSTFNSNGMVTTSIGTDIDIGQAVAIQSDGKIVVGGYSYDCTGHDYDFAIVRYDTNGFVDSTFHVNGFLTTDFSGRDDYSHAIAIQSDGKIVLAGSANSEENIAVIRYMTTNSQDSYIPIVIND